MTKFNNIDDYIKAQPEDVADRLTAIRKLFHAVLPHTKESIRYNIPAFSVGNYYLYISGYKQHIGMYPISTIAGLEKQIEPFKGKGTKDSLHFKHTEPLPVELIEKIIIAKDTETA